MSSGLSPTHNILFTIPRTASNLVVRILNLPKQQPIARHPEDGYFFLPTQRHRYMHSTAGSPVQDWTNDQRCGMDAALHDSSTAWQNWVEQAHLQGKSTYIKEHINWMVRPIVETNFLYNPNETKKEFDTNPTCIPDSFLRIIRPTFLIRHPALVVPSLVRTALDNEGMREVLDHSSEMTMQWETTYNWHISLYRHILGLSTYPSLSHDPDITFPIILDASDVSDESLVRKYATAVGLNADALQFDWNAAADLEGMEKIDARMKDTLLKSRGVLVEKMTRVADIDVVAMKKEWTSEFGEDLGPRVGRLVESAMKDYEWMWERRMKV
jgi:hypothetical protein